MIEIVGFDVACLGLVRDGLKPRRNLRAGNRLLLCPLLFCEITYTPYKRLGFVLQFFSLSALKLMSTMSSKLAGLRKISKGLLP
jgi:hypothetical protein